MIHRRAGFRRAAFVSVDGEEVKGVAQASDREVDDHHGGEAVPTSDVPPLPPDAAPITPGPAASSGDVPNGPVGAPAVLPDFRLLAKIGEGGFGSVWIAQNHHTADAVAIKFVPPQNRQIELAGLQMLRQRVREGQDHLLWTEYIGEANGFIYCVMDLADPVVEGPLFADRYEAMTLLRFMKQHGRIEPSEVVQIAGSMVKGLAFLQSVGLRHGDIKPANVLRVRGRWKLADYGMMGALESRARGGTRSYLPPEGPHGDRADQYAIGIVLHEMVFGHKPGKDSASAWPGSRLGVGLQRIFARLTDANPEKRFAHFKEVVAELEGLERTSASARTSSGATCSHCGHPCGGQEEFCGQCGNDLWRPCPFCEHRGAITQRFCTQCRGPVLGYSTVRDELGRAEAMLSEGRHREVLQQTQGGLRDLCAEFDRDLARLVGGDAGRRRRCESIRQEVSARLSRIAAIAQELTNIDGQIAAAHASLDPQSLRELLRRTTELVPKSRHYSSLHLEIPRLEARLAVRQLLGVFGHPDRAPQEHPVARLQAAIAALRRELPTEPEALVEAKAILQRLEGEVASRLRRRCEQAARWHLQEGRPLEALRWWRRAESRGLADVAMNAEIARVAGELRRSDFGVMVSEAEGLLSRAGGHRMLRRLSRNIAAIDPDHALVKTLRLEWMRRRRIDLLKRLAARAAASAARADFAATSPILGLAYQIAGRDEALRARVVELDNGLGARLRAVESLRASEETAVASGAFEAAAEAVRRAIQIVPDAPELTARLRDHEARVSAVAVRRRRRRTIVMAIVPIVLALLTLGVIDAWTWWSARRAVEGAAIDDFARLASDDREFSPMLLRGILPDPYAGLDAEWMERWREEFGRLVTVPAESSDPSSLEKGVAQLVRMQSSGRIDEAWINDRWRKWIEPRPLSPAVIEGILRGLAVDGSPEEWWAKVVDSAVTPPPSVMTPSAADEWRSLQSAMVGLAEGGESAQSDRLRSRSAEIAKAIRLWLDGRAEERRNCERSVLDQLRRLKASEWDWPGLDRDFATKCSVLLGLDREETPWQFALDLQKVQKTGRVEVSLPGGGSLPFRLARLDGGVLALVAEAQVSEAQWKSVMDPNHDWKGIGKSDAEEFARRFQPLRFLGLSFSPTLPSHAQWKAWRASATDGPSDGDRGWEWVADMDVRGNSPAPQAVRTGNGEDKLDRKPPSGDPQTTVRLFLLEQPATGRGP